MSESCESTDMTVQEQKERIETAVMLTGCGCPCSLHERMTDFTISSVSIALTNASGLDWACGYRVRKQSEPERVDTETLFQACSISKVVTAIAVLRLVKTGHLDLDTDVNLFLITYWKVAATGSWQPKLTIRQLRTRTRRRSQRVLVRRLSPRLGYLSPAWGQPGNIPEILFLGSASVTPEEDIEETLALKREPCE